METLVERCAGLDVYKGSVTALRAGARRPWWALRRDPPVHHDHRGPYVLAEWLASYRVTRVGMESTGCYWVAGLAPPRGPGGVLAAQRGPCNVPGRNPEDADAA